ncbi:MAG: hypothetical protein EOM24_18490 [Chloroflexia bacterium]|nr:hypothetical protein [Chloroflexia bacterium]
MIGRRAMMGSSRPLWTLADVSTALWLDAADTSSLTIDGAAVTAVADKSGLGRNFAQSTPDLQPFVAEVNGKTAIGFAGDCLTSQSEKSTWTFLHNGTTYSIFSVVKFGSTEDPDALYGLLGTNSGSAKNVGISAGFDDRASVSRNQALICEVTRAASKQRSVRVTDNNFLPVNQNIILWCELDPNNATAASRFAAAVNGDSPIAPNTEASTITTNEATYNLQIGTWGNNVMLMTGLIAEIGIITGAIDSDTNARVVGYLAHKWGLAGNLPSDHPYKSSPPRK